MKGEIIANYSTNRFILCSDMFFECNCCRFITAAKALA